MMYKNNENSSGKRRTDLVCDYVVFDIETTGLSYENDTIVELSAVKVKKGAVVEEFSSLVNPQRRIPAHVSRIHGITDEMVKDAPVLKAVLEDFFRFVGDFVLVGHNIESFDLKFLGTASERLLQKQIPNDYIDTLILAKTLLAHLPSRKLTEIAGYFHISAEGAHRALNDCRMNQKCYEEMTKLQQQGGIPICDKCGLPMVKRSGPYGSFWGCSGFPECRATKKV